MIASFTPPATPPSTPLTLDHQLCFALYSASRAMTAAYREELAELGLTYTQYVVLLSLWQHDRLAMRDLSAQLHLDSATLSPVLKRMEQAGLVERRRLQSDERVVEVAVTEAGRDLRTHIHAVQQRVEATTGLSRTELADLRGALHVVADRLRSHASII